MLDKFLETDLEYIEITEKEETPIGEDELQEIEAFG